MKTSLEPTANASNGEKPESQKSTNTSHTPKVYKRNKSAP